MNTAFTLILPIFLTFNYDVSPMTFHIIDFSLIIVFCLTHIYMQIYLCIFIGKGM